MSPQSLRARPTVSVLTPTQLDPDRADALVLLHEDLCATTAAWEWVVVVDGPGERPVPGALHDDPRVHILRAGRQIGAAAARNLGLGIARGAWITTADDDDRLPAGSLDVRLRAASTPGVLWAAGRIADCRDAVTVPGDHPLPAGPVTAGTVWRTWACPCLPFPLGPTTLLADADLLRRVGGWQGLPQAEDLGMVLAVTGTAPGIVLDDVVYVYCRHDAQMTAQPDFAHLEPLVRHITFERGRLLAGSRMPRADAPMPETPTMGSVTRPVSPAATAPADPRPATTDAAPNAAAPHAAASTPPSHRQPA